MKPEHATALAAADDFANVNNFVTLTSSALVVATTLVTLL